MARHDEKRPITYRERDALQEAILRQRALYGGGPGWVALLSLHVGEYFDRTQLGESGIDGYVERVASELERKRTGRK